MSQKQPEETNKSGWGTGRMRALKIVCIRVLGLYIIVLIVMMGKRRFKLKWLSNFPRETLCLRCHYCCAVIENRIGIQKSRSVRSVIGPQARDSQTAIFKPW